MDHIKLIESIGGTRRTAVLCEVSDSAVSQWRTAGIPKHQLKFIKAVRPDLFPDEAPKKRPRKAA